MDEIERRRAISDEGLRSTLPLPTSHNEHHGEVPGEFGRFSWRSLSSEPRNFSRRKMSEIVNQVLPIVYLARHGETAWTLSGQHTGLTDLPLTERGERNARRLKERLRGLSFAKVFTSPLQRARRTCELAGFGDLAEIDPDLLEWNYGEYEGRRTIDIHKERPDWQIFRDGCPGGESPSQVGVRADRAVKHIRAIEGNVLLFSSGHFLRVLAARWLGFERRKAESCC